MARHSQPDASALHVLRPAVFKAVPNLVAGFSTRFGGVSQAPYEALNLSLSSADDEADVLENRQRLFGRVGFSLDQLAIAGQVHGTEILTVTEPGLFSGYDGLVTDQPNILLCITAADCAAVLLSDEQTGVIGACHAGWRGAAGGIVGKTLTVMESLGAAAGRSRAYVSPCISVRHFEVGPEVAEQFPEAHVYWPAGQPKPHVDLKGVLLAQLQERGVPADHIEIDDACTYGEHETFFSYRAEKGLTGRMMGFIGRK